jgi:hypothetical protein
MFTEKSTRRAWPSGFASICLDTFGQYPKYHFIFFSIAVEMEPVPPNR